MDEFLKEINALCFWNYIKHYTYPDNMDIELKEDVIIIDTRYSHSYIAMADYQIFEFRVSNTVNQEDEFYLHFQMKNLKHALDLFKEMLLIIGSLVHKPKTKILLTCSGGMTTSYFAYNLNESAKMLHRRYEFEACGYEMLDEVCQDYSIILLAPQISYQHAHVQMLYPNKVVLKIPPRVFASYDTGTMLRMIEETQIKKEKSRIVLSLGDIKQKHEEILTLIIIRNSTRIHVGYRLFGHHNDILEDDEIIKTTLTVDDLFDIIDMMMIKHKHIDAVVLSTPGIINDGIIDTMAVPGMKDGTNIKEAFSKRYHQKLILCNDVNSVAVGFHACQRQYHNISVIFQPIETNAGLGHIVNDRLHIGHHSLSGEIQYMPLKLSKSRFELNKTVEGTIELLTQICLSSIITIAPEAIVICNELLDVDKLKESLKTFVPEKYLPDIIQIPYMQDYSFIGGFLLALKELDK